MKLRNVEKLKKTAKAFKNISVEINGKKVSELNPGLSKTLEKLIERKQLLSALDKTDATEAEIEDIYKRIEKNSAYFIDLTAEDREQIENSFATADDKYARTAQWQSFSMAFTATEGLSVYKELDDFNSNVEDLKKRRSEIIAAQKKLKAEIKKLQEKYPGLTTETATAEYEKYKKERETLQLQINKLEEEYSQKEQETSQQQLLLKAEHKKEINVLKTQMETLYSEYRNKKKELKGRNDIKEAARLKSLIDSTGTLTVAGKDFYKQVASKLETQEYFNYLNTKEYTQLKEEYTQLKEKQEKAKTEVAKNATGALKKYLEFTPEQKETADIDVIKYAIGFFIVCRDPNGKTAKQFLERHPEFGAPIVAEKNVGEFLKRTLARKDKARTEEQKKLVVFAESFKAAMKDFAAVYLKDVPNPTEAQINEVISMLENGSPKEGQYVLRAQRKAIEKGIENRKEAIFAEFTDKDKADYAVYTAPDKTGNILNMLEKSRTTYNYEVERKKATVYAHDKITITLEEAEGLIQEKCDKQIEKIMEKHITESNLKLYLQTGIKLENWGYFSYLNTKQYTALKEEYIRIKAEQEKAKAEVAKNATGALKIYLDPGPTAKDIADIEVITKAKVIINICRYPNSPAARKYFENHPEQGAPFAGITGSIKEFLDEARGEKQYEVSAEFKKVISFAEAVKPVLKDAAVLLLKDEKNPTEAQIDQVVEMLINSTPKEAELKMDEQIKAINNAVKTRKETAFAEFTDKDKADYAVYTSPEKTDQILSKLEKSRENYGDMIKREIERALKEEKKEITKEEAEIRLQEYCDLKIANLIKQEIEDNGIKPEDGKDVKDFNVSAADRKIRYDKWLKKELEKIDAYENHLDSYKKLEVVVAKNNQQIEENKKRMEKIAEITEIISNKSLQHQTNMKKLEKDLEDAQNETEQKINDLETEADEKYTNMKVITWFKNSVNRAQLGELKKAIDKQCSDAPRLNTDPVAIKLQNTAEKLMRKKTEFADGHKNSDEFNAMMDALQVLTEWGKPDGIMATMKNPPKTKDEAYDQLKAASQKYIIAKDGQKRLFPSKLRYLRYELADALISYADEAKEHDKDIMDKNVAESWNMYFESRGTTPIIKVNKPEKGEKRIYEADIDSGEIDFVME